MSPPKQKNIAGDSVKSIAKVEANGLHHSLFTHKSSYFVIEGNKFSQA